MCCSWAAVCIISGDIGTNLFYIWFLRKFLIWISFCFLPKIEKKHPHHFLQQWQKMIWSLKLPPHCKYRRLDFPLLNKFMELVDIYVIQVTLDLMISMNFRGTIIKFVNMGFHLLHSTYLCPISAKLGDQYKTEYP